MAMTEQPVPRRPAASATRRACPIATAPPMARMVDGPDSSSMDSNWETLPRMGARERIVAVEIRTRGRASRTRASAGAAPGSVSMSASALPSREASSGRASSMAPSANCVRVR